jgi:hypothetical protein
MEVIRPLLLRRSPFGAELKKKSFVSLSKLGFYPEIKITVF